MGEIQTAAEQEAARLEATAKAAAPAPPPAVEPPAGVRGRDVLGQTSARSTANEERLNTVEETLGQINESLQQMAGGGYADPYAPASAAPPAAVPMIDPRTGATIFVDPAALAPSAPPQARGAEATPAAQQDYLFDQVEQVSRNLQWYGDVHPTKAESMAAEIVAKSVNSGKPVDTVLFEYAEKDAGVHKFMVARAEETAKMLGGKAEFPTAAAEVVPAADALPVTPAPGQEGAAQAAPAPDASAAVTEPQVVVPAVEDGASTTPTTPPPNADGDTSDIAALVDDAKRASDGKFIANAGG